MTLGNHQAFAVLVALFASACAADDTLVLDDNFGALTRESDPVAYALGTEIRFEARRGLFDNDDPIGDWRFEVSDSSVVEVLSEWTDNNKRLLSVTARAPGTATIRVHEGRKIRGEATIRVAPVASVRLLDRAIERASGQEQVLAPRMQIVNGSSTAAEVRYYDESGQRLFGRRILSWDELPTMEISTDEATLGRDREYLLMSSKELGETAVELRIDNTVISTLTLVSVDESQIESVELYSDESNAQEGQRVCAAVLTYDALGERVLGPPVEWAVEGMDIEGLWEPADILCYEYYPDRPTQTVVATVGGEGVKAEIHGDNFRTESSSTVGCSAGSPATSAFAGLAVVLMMLLAGRRKRRATSLARR